MAKILNTDESWSAIEHIIEDANDFIVLISPFLGNKDILSLVNKRRDNIYLQLFTLEPSKQKKFISDVSKTICKLEKLPNIKVHYGNVDFHAKCYFNEKEVLITSMNLSNIVNIEFGVLVSKEWDKSLFADTMRLVNNICEKFGMFEESAIELSNRRLGFCIKCGKSIDLDLYQPYCELCLVNYNPYDYRNGYYRKECKCHWCGSSFDSSKDYPMHRSCYYNYKKFISGIG